MSWFSDATGVNVDLNSGGGGDRPGVNLGQDFVLGFANSFANSIFDLGRRAANGLGDNYRNLSNTVQSAFDPNNPLNILNLQTNWATMGLAGYDGRGFNVQAGGVTNALDEASGEISGRNLARESLYQQGQLIAREDARRAQLLADQRLQNQNADIAASNSVAAGRLPYRGAMTTRGGVPILMGDVAQGDLLGL